MSPRNLLLVVIASMVAIAAGMQAQDVVKVSPATNKVLVENAYVRVVQATFAPGASEPVHTHPASWYYVTQAGRLRVTYATGKVEIWEPKVGESAWMNGEAPHSAENVGETTLQYILVEVKGAPTKTPH